MMDNALLNLTHEQQQQAVERIQQLMLQGTSSGEAIAIVAKQLREQYSAIILNNAKGEM
ncbi:YoaH family protein [Nicoletella semolina]|nr:YoaH family protein [Nicoletella semolina]